MFVCQLPQAFRRLPRPSISQYQDIPHVPLVDWPSKSRTQESRCRLGIYLTISHVKTAAPAEALATVLHRILYRIRLCQLNPLARSAMPNQPTHRTGNASEELIFNPPSQHSAVDANAPPTEHQPSVVLKLDANYQTTKLSKINASTTALGDRRRDAAGEQPVDTTRAATGRSHASGER